jgi:hypothetical protein
MMFPRSLQLILFSVIVVAALPLYGQDTDHPWYDPLAGVYSATLGPSDSLISLPHPWIIDGTEIVYVDTVRLNHGIHYFLDARYGILTLFRSAIHSPDTSLRHQIKVLYRRYPFSLQSSYERLRLVYRHDSLGRQQAFAQKAGKAFSVEDIFGPNLQKSGSIARGFSVGSDRDLSLTSGFRMQLAGKLSQDIDIVAALTDENTPIQPEGNTQSLQEFDKVFVEITSPSITTTLGDFNLVMEGTEFARVARKLQGVKAASTFMLGSTSDTVFVSGSVTRGKFSTNQFNGVDGIQGPYRLTGRNNERAIIIIAGTEKVYLNGEIMTRGEANDYSIDYANAEVVFSTRRLITSLSRVTIDFQYTDRQYSRSLLSADARSSFADGDVHLGISYMREADNPDATIDLQLDDEDKRLLRESGADWQKASKTGAVFVGRDSITGTGKGQYIGVDTLDGQVPKRIYRYAPGSPDAVYSVSFSFVGDGAGEYRKDRIGAFTYVGPLQGAYVPVQYLPLPEETQLADMRFSVAAGSAVQFSGEYAMSRYNANRFASIDNAVTNGSALNATIRVSPTNIMIGSLNVGNIDIQLHERYVTERFTPLDRTNVIEFSRAWNVTRPVAGDEEIREGHLTYSPMQASMVSFRYGLMRRGDNFTTGKFEGGLAIGEKDLPSIAYSFERLSTTDNGMGQNSLWFRQKGAASYTISIGEEAAIGPGVRFNSEDKKDILLANDSLTGTSYRFVDVAPTISLTNFLNMSLTGEYGFRVEDAPVQGGFIRQSVSRTQALVWKLKEWKSLSSSVDLTFRQKQYEKQFQSNQYNDIHTVLLRAQTRYAPWNRALEADAFYEAATQRSAKLERVFIRVPKGTGNYIYLGDLNGNEIADESEFQLSRFDGDYIVTTTPTDQYIPIIDIKASTRVRLSGQKFITAPAGTIESILANLSSETYLRVEERSSEQDRMQMYLLHLSHFQNDATTILGLQQITQDLYVCENSQQFSLRFRFSERRGFNQYATGSERTLTIERNGRIRWQLIPEVSHQVEITQKRDRLLASAVNNRIRDISALGVNSDLSYRPEQNLEIGFVFMSTSGQDQHPVISTEALVQVIGLRGVKSLQGKGQIRIEVQREDVRLSAPSIDIPFELTGGRSEGKTWLWSMTMDYRLGGNVQASLNYNGRSEAQRRTVHMGRVEVRAFF